MRDHTHTRIFICVHECVFFLIVFYLVIHKIKKLVCMDVHTFAQVSLNGQKLSFASSFSLNKNS